MNAHYYSLPGIWMPEPEEVINHICRQRWITLEQLRSQDRSRNIALARQECMYLIRRHCKPMTDGQIGRLLNRDRTTVIHCLQSLQDFIDTEPEYRKELRQLHDSLFTKAS